MDWIVRIDTTPNDALWGSISAAMNKISAPAAWGITTGSSAVKVCVIDTGVNHL